MAITDNNNNEIINAWQNLIEQSVKANTAFLQESAKLFTDVLSKKTEAKDLLKINTDVLNTAINNFIKLNVANTENLMNFGVTVSRSFFSFADTNTNTGNNSGKEETATGTAEPVTATGKNQINLSVKQGEQITTSFYLNSHNAFAQSGRFYPGNFVNEVTGTAAGLSMEITPKEFMLEPAKSLKVDILINAAGDITPGKYTSTVRLDGMDNQEFDIVVDVTESIPVIPTDSIPAPVISKSTAKKSSPKKKNKQ